MANWLHHLDISKEWKQVQEGEITVAQLAQAIADKLDGLFPKAADGRAHVSKLMRDFAASGSDDADEFDNIMAVLYDWGDTTLSVGKWPPDKLCWINTWG